jgi:hypothetical protein
VASHSKIGRLTATLFCNRGLIPCFSTLSGSIDYRHFAPGRLAGAQCLRPASITRLMPRRAIISSSCDAKPWASSEAVTAGLRWTNGDAAFAAFSRRGIGWRVSRWAAEIQRRYVGGDIDFIGPRLNRLQHFDVSL